MRLKNLLVGVILFVGNPLFSQIPLGTIPDDLNEYYNQRKAQAIEYAIANNLPIKQVFADGTIIEIQYLDESGKPLYYKTFNAEAAFTTGTDMLYNGADLGLNLSGKGFKVGVWDGGLPRATHLEFGGRVQIVEGSSVSNHATHVTGTILAQGLDPRAKGMAFEANSVNYDGLNGDNAEMKTEAQNGLLISNHSYGSVLGWNFNGSNGSWQWFGDVSVSSLEDYRFGYYSGASAIWDDIAFKNPNYLIVKSAGNDRTDIGDGNGPPPDGPYDIVGQQGVAKNILTVGSANPLSSAYVSPADVTLAPYSSWGPTDDGRIKPDIVGMGQSLYSTSSDGDDQYTVLSGTSMSSPNVTGSLALLQQLYYQMNGVYLSAAALKSLVIHTAHETGIADGPDYQFGWGLLNMGDAAKLLMLNGNPEFVLKQDSLLQGATFTMPFTMAAGQKLTATLVWTDPPGEAETVAAVDPPAIKLINDLDIRVTDEGGTTYFPWIMNPVTKQASKADNFRDNVEKIELIAPTAGIYTVSITHKDSLLNSSQDFALTISAENLSTRLKSFYFVGSNGNFLDQANWSDVSGGAPIGQVPGANDIIIFDDNSQGTLPQGKITLPGNFSCFSLASSDSSIFELDLNGNVLSLESKISITNSNFIVSNGTVGLIGQNVAGAIDLLPGSLSSTNVLISNNSQPVNLLSVIDVDTLMIMNGNFNSNSFAINTSSISIDNSSVSLGSSRIAKLNNFNIIGLTTSVFTTSTSLTFDGVSTNKTFVGGGTNIGSIKVVSNNLSISGLNMADSIIVESSLTLLESAISRVAKVMGSSSLFIGDGQELNVEESLLLNSSSGNRIQIDNYVTGAGTSGSIRSEKNPKLCFDYVDVANISATGNTKFVVGANSTLTNANGWIQGVCQDILASAFSYQFTCAGGVTYFTDTSDGNPDSWIWDFGDSTAISTAQSPTHSYLDTGTYIVKLVVGLGTESSTSTTTITIDIANLAVPTVILDNDQLRSTSFAPNYQWYLDIQSISGANDYFLTSFFDPGAYHIEIWNDVCRLVSDPMVITGLDDVLNSIHVFPNPFTNTIIVRSELKGQMTVVIRDIMGKMVFRKISAQGSAELLIDTSEFNSGIYFIDVAQNNDRDISRIIKFR
jgi:PKD repeat protein